MIRPSGPAFLLLANPNSGSIDDDTVATVHRELERHAPVDVVPMDDDDTLDDVLRHTEARCVVAMGGDGSIHRVANRLHATQRLDLDVGLIPTGTGNDLARGTGLPLDAAAAARGLAGWPARPVDLLEVEDGVPGPTPGDRVVVNAVHVGVGAEAAHAANAWKSRLGALAYPLGAVVTGARATPWRMRVVVDGHTVHDGPALLAGIGNGPVIGGGTPMFPRAGLDDGRAEVIVVGDRWGRPGLAAFGQALRRGRHTTLPWVHAGRGRHVVVSGEAVPGNADGELWRPREAWEVRVLTGALRLRRPASRR